MIKISEICTPEEIAWIKIVYKLFNGQKMFLIDNKLRKVKHKWI